MLFEQKLVLVTINGTFDQLHSVNPILTSGIRTQVFRSVANADCNKLIRALQVASIQIFRQQQQLIGFFAADCLSSL